MTVETLLMQYDFHDSQLVTVDKKKEGIALTINLCMWKQKDYKEGEPELKEVTFFFREVESYSWDSEKTEWEIDFDEILQITYSDNIVKIILYNEVISIMSFICREVRMIN